MHVQLQTDLHLDLNPRSILSFESERERDSLIPPLPSPTISARLTLLILQLRKKKGGKKSKGPAGAACLHRRELRALYRSSEYSNGKLALVLRESWSEGGGGGHEKNFCKIKESRMEERLVFAFRATPSPGGLFSEGRNVGVVGKTRK